MDGRHHVEVARSDFDDLLLGKELPEEKNLTSNQKNKKETAGKEKRQGKKRKREPPPRKPRKPTNPTRSNKKQQEIRPDSLSPASRAISYRVLVPVSLLSADLFISIALLLRQGEGGKRKTDE